MKTATKLGTIGAPIITINPELDKYDDVVLFPEKVAKAKEVIARAGLPNLSITNNIRSK
jgi:hypothetical protein